MRYLRPLQTFLSHSASSLTTEMLRQRLTAPTEITSSVDNTPIVFMHGFMGLTSFSLFNRRLLDYFNGAEHTLNNAGFHAYHPTINPIHSPAVRAQTWASEIDRLLRKTRTKQVHLITHGQAAIDAKILACPTSMRCKSRHGDTIQGLGFDDRIASITTLGGPHLGTPLADGLLNRTTPKGFIDLIDYIALLQLTTSKAIKHCLSYLTSDFINNVFNPAMHVPNHIPCYLIAANPMSHHYISPILDQAHASMKAIADYDGGGDNDGFTPLRSALYHGNCTRLANSDRKQWQSLGQITTDHFGLVGNPLLNSKQFNYAAFLQGLAQHNDTHTRQHIRMQLQTNGHWQRQPIEKPPQKTLQKSGHVNGLQKA